MGTASVSVSTCKSTYYTNQVVAPIVLVKDGIGTLNLNIANYLTLT